MGRKMRSALGRQCMKSDNVDLDDHWQGENKNMLIFLSLREPRNGL